MSKRSAAWYVREVEKSNRENPGKPIRFDITADDRKITREAYLKLIFPGDGRLVSWRYLVCEHPESEELYRAVYLSPEGAPEPVETIPVPYRKDRGAWSLLAREKQEQLQKKYGGEYHVEGCMSGGLRDKHGDTGPVCKVWKGEDWLALRYASLYPAEVARALDRGTSRKFAIKFLEPLARKGKEVSKRGRDHADRMNKSKVEVARELHAYIRKQYKTLEPGLRSKELRVGEAYDSIQSRVRGAFGKEISFSMIDRALGKKDSKRKKK